MLYEDDVVDAVVESLKIQGWSIESQALATQHGDDIVASRDGQRLLIEAKGEGSSKAHTARFGRPFDRQQVMKHVASAVFRSLKVVSEGTTLAAIAFPITVHHRREVAQVWPALSSLGIRVYWVAEGGIVSEGEPLG